MNISELKLMILRNLSNIPGWSTRRKIVVIESDDWGSIRMSSHEAQSELSKAGMQVCRNHYNLYDCLESNTDLEMLMLSLQKHKDKNDRYPVLTGVNIVANPDFEKIRSNGFSKYEYESVTETFKRYPEHDKVSTLWQQGTEQRLLVPIFHGREHLNVNRWMQALQSNNLSTHLGFQHQITGIPGVGINNEDVPDFQAAFDIDSLSDIEYQKEVLKTGLDLFEKLYGFKSAYFVPTNGPFNNALEKVLHESGVKFINTAKVQQEPLGNGAFKKHVRFLGQQNQYGQRYITRNCFFEPSSMEHPANTDWVGNCLKEMEIAFRWHKPAVISTHRVNYVGFLYAENRERGLKQLSELLKKMLKKWPDIEFMTSVELGNHIVETKK